jgi:putative transposase
VLDVLHEPRFVDKAPPEVYALLLDEGKYFCSPRTMYRILLANGEVKERRDQARHPAYVKPELLATGPNQVWSWDITRIKGPAKWTHFYLYVILDIFSRFVVGWMLAEQENARLAKRLIAETIAREGVDKNKLVLHSDRGAPMTALTTVQLLAYLGVTPSFSRPRTSNDNPFSEAQFRTFKYHPTIPDRVASLQHGLTVCRTFFAWYNFEHRHSGISYLTPAMVHRGQAKTVIAERRRTLAAAYAAQPQRFVKGLPSPKQPAAAVWINPPGKTSTQIIAGDANGVANAH